MCWGRGKGNLRGDRKEEEEGEREKQRWVTLRKRLHIVTLKLNTMRLSQFGEDSESTPSPQVNQIPIYTVYNIPINVSILGVVVVSEITYVNRTDKNANMANGCPNFTHH